MYQIIVICRTRMFVSAVKVVDCIFCDPCAGDEIPIANFCNGSMATLSGTSSFLPGEDVTINCSLPGTGVRWTSPQFSESPVLVNNILTIDTRLDGAVIFTLTTLILDPSPCATSTATIADIQESMQGLSLTCTDIDNLATITIDVIGKLHVVCKIMSFMSIDL